MFSAVSCGCVLFCVEVFKYCSACKCSVLFRVKVFLCCFGQMQDLALFIVKCFSLLFVCLLVCLRSFPVFFCMEVFQVFCVETLQNCFVYNLSYVVGVLNPVNVVKKSFSVLVLLCVDRLFQCVSIALCRWEGFQC